MSNDKKLFERVVSNGLYCDLATVPSQRAGNGHTRYEVIDQTGRLLGKGATKSAALDQAWKSFQQDK